MKSAACKAPSRQDPPPPSACHLTPQPHGTEAFLANRERGARERSWAALPSRKVAVVAGLPHVPAPPTVASLWCSTFATIPLFRGGGWRCFRAETPGAKFPLSCSLQLERRYLLKVLYFAATVNFCVRKTHAKKHT